MKKELRSAAAKLRQANRIKELAFEYLQLRTEALPGKIGEAASWAWSRRQGVRLLLVTSIAAGLTWQLAALADIKSPIIAVLAGTLTVQSAVHASVRDGLARIGATIAAMAVAVAVLHLLGIHAWSLSVVVAVSLVAGRLMGLGAGGAIQVPATSLGIFVAGVAALDRALVTDRIMATVLGVSIGVGLSFFAHRASPAERAREEIEKLNREVAQQLAEMSEQMSQDPARCLEKSRETMERVERTRILVANSNAAARWAGAKGKEEAREIALAAKALEHSAEQANSLARTFYDLQVENQPLVLAKEISDMLERTSAAFEIKAEELKDKEVGDDALEKALERIEEDKKELLASARELDDTATWLVSGAVISSVDRMVESLDQSAPALTLGQEKAEKGLKLKLVKVRKSD